jgi:hypothetical protein
LAAAAAVFGLAAAAAGREAVVCST